MSPVTVPAPQRPPPVKMEPDFRKTAESICYMTSWGPAPEVTEEESELGKIPGIHTTQVPQTFREGRT